MFLQSLMGAEGFTLPSYNPLLALHAAPQLATTATAKTAWQQLKSDGGKVRRSEAWFVLDLIAIVENESPAKHVWHKVLSICSQQ